MRYEFNNTQTQSWYFTIIPNQSIDLMFERNSFDIIKLIFNCIEFFKVLYGT